MASECHQVDAGDHQNSHESPVSYSVKGLSEGRRPMWDPLGRRWCHGGVFPGTAVRSSSSRVREPDGGGDEAGNPSRKDMGIPAHPSATTTAPPSTWAFAEPVRAGPERGSGVGRVVAKKPDLAGGRP